MAPEASNNDVLQSVSDTEKNNLHNNHNHENVITIENTLNATYEQKSIGGIDAKHDAKVIALKYFSGSYKNNELTTGLDKSAIDINSFVTIRNELGKDFFDNLLYKYDVPYCQIEALANDLSALQDAQKHELHENHTKMKARLSKNGEPVTTQVAEKNTPVAEKNTPEAGSNTQKIEKSNGQKVNSIFELQNIDEIQNGSIINIFNVEFTVNDSLKTYLKDSVAILKELGLESEINALLPGGITKEETMLIAQKVIDKVKGNTAVLLKIQKSYDALDPENKNKLNQFSQMMKSDNTYGLTSKNGPEQAKRNSDALSKQENNLKQEMKNMYLPEGFSDKMVGPIMNRWYGRINEKVRSYNIGKDVDKQLTQQQLNDLTYRSPFRQESCTGAIPDIQDLYVGDLMKKIAEAFIKDPKNKRCNDLTPQNIGSVLQSYTKIIDQSEKDTFVGNNTIIGEAKNDLYTKKVLQEFVDQFENGKSDASTAKSAIEVLVESGKGFVDMTLGFLKSPAMQELFKELQKIFEILGWSTSMFDNILKLNEVATGDLTVLQVATLDAGQKLCKEQKVTTSTDPALKDDGTGNLKPDFLEIGEMMNSKIFNQGIGGYGSDRKDCDLWSKGFMDKVGKSNYQLLFKEYTASTGIQANDADLLDLSMWNMCGKNPNNAEFQQFQELRKQDIHDEAALLYKNKITTMVAGLADKREVKEAKWGENANESATRIIFGNLIAGEKGAKSVIDAKKNIDTQKEQINEAQKNVEINKFKESLQLEKNIKGNVKITPEQGWKVQIEGKDVEYNSIDGLKTDGKSFSIINTDEKHKTKYGENAIKVENITLLTPTIDTKEIKTEGKIKLTGLSEDKDYTAKMLNDQNEPIGSEQSLKIGKARELTIDKDKTPSYLILKQDDNGIKQRFAFPKQAET